MQTVRKQYLLSTTWLLAATLCACSSDDKPNNTKSHDDAGTLINGDTASSTSDASEMNAAGHAAGANAAEQSAVATDAGVSGDTLTEKSLTLELSLAIVKPDAGAEDDSDAGAPKPTAELTITARDGSTPLNTDLWLYTVNDAGEKKPLTAFTASTKRKSPNLMLPAKINGKSSGLEPADNGDANGLMTGTTRGMLEQGAFVSTVTGTVIVTLADLPTQPILVIAAVEDQRYAGAAAIAPDGTPAKVPDGVGAPQTHPKRSFLHDVQPILVAECGACHNAKGPNTASFYLLTGSRDDLVNDNFALKEGTAKCKTANPKGGDTLAACVQALTQAEYLVEPGAPAASGLLVRARPDENAGTSPTGLLWYGSKGARYSATYGDRRMPSTTYSTDMADWKNDPTPFDMKPADYQVLFDWVAQGALP